MEKSLPKGWVETELGNFAYLKNGYAYKTTQFKDSGIPILKISNITKDGKVDISNPQYVDESLINEAFLVKPGDIVIAMSGATTGKFGVYNSNELLLQNQRVGNIKLQNDALGSKKFLYYLIASLRKEIEDRAYGGAQPNISPTLIETIQIPLPPLAEQERIVAKLDKLFAQHDKIKKALDRIPELLKAFRQQVLTQAVTGKLTEQWREGKELGEWNAIFEQQINVRSELIKNKQLKSKSYDSIHDKEKDIIIPEEWLWMRWNDILHFSNHSMKRGPFGSALKKEFFVESGVRVFEQYNPINDDPYFQRYYVTHAKFQELESFKATSGDLLISCSGTLGRITEIPDDTEYGIINQALLKLTLNWNLITNSYFTKLFRSDYIQKKIFDNAKGSSIPNMVGVDELKKMPLPMPPIQEQQEIVRRVESLFAKADTIEERYKILKEKIEHLPQAILHKAFKGQLVPQLPTDGDAKDLLAEIMALKEEVKGKVKGKK